MNEKRESGLASVGLVPWGTHFCQFYQKQADLIEIIVPYFQAGLKNNEFCIWVTSEFITGKEALQAMQECIPQFVSYLKSGQMEVFSYSKWITKYDEGLARGFEGLRVSGNPFWINNKKDWDDFAQYEAEINKVIGQNKLLALCTYSLEKCGASEVIEVVNNHQFALIKKEGIWKLIKSNQLNESQRALQVTEKRFQDTLDNLLEGCQIISPDYRYLYINYAAAKQGRFTKKHLLGKTMMEMYPGIENTEMFFQLKKCMSERVLVVMETEFVFANGDVAWFELSMQPVPEGVFILSVDITTRKQLEQLKDEFLGVATHELKTPVTSIKAYAQVLVKILKDKGDVSAAKMIEKLEDQVDRLISLITTLLDITKIQTGKLQFNKNNFDFNEMANKVIEEITRIYPNHKIIRKLTKTKTIFGDQERIGQVITNLITNAIKYSPEKSKIYIKTETDDKKITFIVQDFGIGIPKSEQKKVFERFYQIPGSSGQIPTGLGLGLYISSEIIKRHRGRIGVKSKVNEGSTFYFSLPLKIGAA